MSSYGPVFSNGMSGGQPTVLLSSGLPTPVPIDPINPSGAIIAVSQDFKSTRVQQFNVIVEKDKRITARHVRQLEQTGTVRVCLKPPSGKEFRAASRASSNVYGLSTESPQKGDDRYVLLDE